MEVAQSHRSVRGTSRRGTKAPRPPTTTNPLVGTYAAITGAHTATRAAISRFGATLAFVASSNQSRLDAGIVLPKGSEPITALSSDEPVSDRLTAPQARAKAQTSRQKAGRTSPPCPELTSDPKSQGESDRVSIVPNDSKPLVPNESVSVNPLLPSRSTVNSVAIPPGQADLKSTNEPQRQGGSDRVAIILNDPKSVILNDMVSVNPL